MDEKRSCKSSIVCIVVFLATAWLLLFAARRITGFAQWYSVTVYPLLVGSIGRISGLVSCSLAEILCLALPVLIITDLIVSGIRKKSGGSIIRILLLSSLLFLLYASCCGVNYYREPYLSPETIESADLSQKDLADFCEYTAERLDECYGIADCNNLIIENKADITADGYPVGRDLEDLAVSAINSIGDDRLDGYYPRPKVLHMLSGFFSSMGVSGIYSPFTIEANINGEMPGMERPFTACHELSHLRGFMNEGEANYLGWLACIFSDNEAFNRSGWLIAWTYAGGTLHRTDPDRFSEIYRKLPDEAVKELRENDEFWRSRRTKASDVQDKVNDAYLKSNGQNMGIETYGQLTAMMLTWFKSQ